MPTEPLSSDAQSAAARRAIIMANIYAKNTGKIAQTSTTRTAPLRITSVRLRTAVIQSRLPMALPRPVYVEEDEQGEYRQQKLHLIKGIIFIVLGIVLFSVLANASRPIAHTQTQQLSIKYSSTPTHRISVPTKVIHAVARIGQASLAQYASKDEYDTWWASVCSTAAMAEIFNAYGNNYRITDVLKIEAGLQNPQEITSNKGLLQNSAIDRTSDYFGFRTTWLRDSLDGIIQRANNGNPILVNFPPDKWEGGHFLLVTGGNATQVNLVDSSNINKQVMSRENFLTYWVGLAALITPKVPVSTSGDTYSVIGGPTLSVDFMNQVLSAYHSPAAGKAQALYDFGVRYGIDPAFALGFFYHESRFGTAGEARITLALGNLRCIQSRPCINTESSTCQADQSCYAKFYSWEDGFEGWYIQIRAYINGGINQVVGKKVCPCTTASQIIPVYAPPTDGNDDSIYIKTVETAIDTWHSAKIRVPNVA